MSTNLNLPGITKIEYMLASDIDLPSYLPVQPELDISGLISGSFTEIIMVKRSANLVQNLAHQNPGDLFSIELPFNIAGIDSATIALTKLLRSAEYVYRVTDANDQQYLIGHPTIRARIEFQFTNKANPSGQRGYSCKVSLDSPQGLIFIT